MLTDEQVAAAAEALYRAELDNVPIAPISETFPDADVDDAYRISTAVTELKVRAGRIVKGHKIGLTSKAMRELTGASEPDYGTMFDDWFVLEGSTVSRARMNRPLVEVELAFVLKEPLASIWPRSFAYRPRQLPPTKQRSPFAPGGWWTMPSAFPMRR